MLSIRTNTNDYTENYGSMTSAQDKNIWKKTVQHPGRGLYRPNELSTVVVDVVGKWYTLDDGEKVFDEREKDTITIGECLKITY